MTRVLRCASLIGVLMAALACGTDQPTAPSTVPGPPGTPAPGPLPQPRPPGDPVATYVYSGPLDYPSRSYTAGSQYVLYDNGVFGLRYDALGLVYLGRYNQDDATITFRFDGTWTWNQGTATGTIKGDLMEVRYSDIMVHSDFENATYRRAE